MTERPTPVSKKQLDELFIQLKPDLRREVTRSIAARSGLRERLLEAAVLRSREEVARLQP